MSSLIPHTNTLEFYRAAPPRPAQPGWTLAAGITRAASAQTYFTVRCLVDRPRLADAFRAYAYFRWLDDRLDQTELDRSSRLALVRRHLALVERCYSGQPPRGLSAHEQMLADLIRADDERNSGLQTYIRHLSAVMAFDAERRGRLITQAELSEYTRRLAAAVTEALHYFIGRRCPPPPSPDRRLAATGAHIAHMLRDALEDNAAGYFNIPSEYLQAHHIGPQDISTAAYRAWVRGRVRLAQVCLAAGRRYLARVPSFRCRLAGCAYIGRFEGVLAIIRREGYVLRSNYPERKSAGAVARLAGSAVWLALEQAPASAAPMPAGEDL